MVKGIRLTRTTDWQTFDDVVTQCPWTTETKYGDATGFDYWSSGTTAVLPVDGGASHYEIFTYAESLNVSNETYYLGTAGTNIGWYGIVQDSAGPGKGSRSGLVPYVSGNTAALQFRSFGSQHFLFEKESLHLGILVDPTPLAVASTGSAIQTNLGSVPTSLTVVKPTIGYDPEGLYNISTGFFTAPTGSTFVVPSINFSSTPYDVDDTTTALYKNGVQQGTYREGNSGRSPSIGCWGLWPTVEGDTWSFRVGKPSATVTYDSFFASCEFY